MAVIYVDMLNLFKFNYVSIHEEPGQLSGTALGYGLDDRGFETRRGWEFFSSPPPSYRLWGPPSLLFNGYQGPFPWA
jgi:hypothetical protein